MSVFQLEFEQRPDCGSIRQIRVVLNHCLHEQLYQSALILILLWLTKSFNRGFLLFAGYMY